MSAQPQETFEETPVPVTQVIDVAFTDQTEDYLEIEAAQEPARAAAAERLQRQQEIAEQHGSR